MSHRLSPLTTRWMPPGASCAHPGTSEALCPLRAVLPVTLARMFGRAGVARAGRGPLAARSSTAAGWAGATATAGVWAAAFAAAAVLVARLVTAPRNASSRMAPAMAPTSTAATRRTGPTGRRQGGTQLAEAGHVLGQRPADEPHEQPRDAAEQPEQHGQGEQAAQQPTGGGNDTGHGGPPQVWRLRFRGRVLWVRCRVR